MFLFAEEGACKSPSVNRLQTVSPHAKTQTCCELQDMVAERTVAEVKPCLLQTLSR